MLRMTPKKLKCIRMSVTTIRLLQKLAKKDERTESDFIRMLIEKAAKEEGLR
jgi:predicted DNA-binding protein